MDTRLKSLTFLTLVLLLASLLASLCSVSEARPLRSHFPGKDGFIEEANGIFRKLKSSDPSPAGGHRLQKLQNLGGMKDSGPSPCCGHRPIQSNGRMKDSGPRPDGGHKLKTLQILE